MSFTPGSRIYLINHQLVSPLLPTQNRSNHGLLSIHINLRQQHHELHARASLIIYFNSQI